MKIAEALAERGDLEKKLKAVTTRARSAARYLEGEESPEDAAELLDDALDLITRRAELVFQINMTNARTEISVGGEMMSLTEALAHRARLSEEVSLLHSIADEASPGRDPYSRGRRRTELPEKTDLPVRELRTRADRLSKQHRELDTLIQQANWSTDLV